MSGMVSFCSLDMITRIKFDSIRWRDRAPDAVWRDGTGPAISVCSAVMNNHIAMRILGFINCTGNEYLLRSCLG